MIAWPRLLRLPTVLTELRRDARVNPRLDPRASDSCFPRLRRFLLRPRPARRESGLRRLHLTWLTFAQPAGAQHRRVALERLGDRIRDEPDFRRTPQVRMRDKPHRPHRRPFIGPRSFDLRMLIRQTAGHSAIPTPFATASIWVNALALVCIANRAPSSDSPWNWTPSDEGVIR